MAYHEYLPEFQCNQYKLDLAQLVTHVGQAFAMVSIGRYHQLRCGHIDILCFVSSIDLGTLLH